jgi:hypothetical protein
MRLPPIHWHEHAASTSLPTKRTRLVLNHYTKHINYQRKGTYPMKRKLTIIAASAVIATSAAFAQMTTTETTTTTSTPVSETTTVETKTYSPGMVIQDSAGTRVGTVERVIERKGGPIIAVNTGERTVLVPRAVLSVSGDHVVYSGKAGLISTAPVWSSSTTYETREAVTPIYKHYDVEIEEED